MPGYHVIVYSARFAEDNGGASVPGHLYVVSTASHRIPDYEVYTQLGPSPYPAFNSHFHGSVSRMHTPLDYYPEEYQVSYYMANYYGTVDCYTWQHQDPIGSWAHYVVEDIDSPNLWWRGSHYRFVCMDHEVQPMSRRARRLGMWRFYWMMAV